MRARSLKPSIFRNEHLAVADPIFTVIFEGLWCMADREGRLEDRPAKIHFEINPGRAFDTTCRSLDWLEGKGFIARYEVAGEHYIAIPNFRKHQNPHHREPPSTIPAPDKPRAGPGLAPGEPQSGPNPAVLTPDSGLRTPDSPFLTPGEANSPGAGSGAKAPKSSEQERSSIGIQPTVNREALKRWEAWMLSIGKPVNDFSRPAIARQLVAFGDAEAQSAAVERCIGDGYRTLRPGNGLHVPGAREPPRKPRKTADELEAEYRAEGKDPYALQ